MTGDDHLLHEQILAAHDLADSNLLAKLYLEAANRMRFHGENEAVPFLLTQAYVFALESGDPIAAQLREELVALGSEA